MTHVSEDFIRALPKTDLHVHLDGSLRLGTLIDLAKGRKVEMPSYTEEGLRDTVFKERYGSLQEYLHGFSYTCAVMQDEEALEQVAYELAWDNINEGVYYIEPRFAPQLHITDRMEMAGVLLAVHRGLKRAKDEHNRSEAVRANRLPPFEYGIIVCAMRMFNEKFSRYYADLIRVHPFTPRKKIFAMASLELAQAAVAIRKDYGVPVVGFDLAGREDGFPADDHTEAYDYVHKNFLKKTVHAGEAYGAESIFQAITDLHADRIGHGFNLFSPWLIKDANIDDKQAYIKALSEYIADRRVTIEVCITSNLQTNPNLKAIEHHAFGDMLRHRLSATFCTDNRLVSHTSVTREIMLATRAFSLSAEDLKHCIIYGFKRSFFPGSYLEKRAYVRRIIDHYEEVQRRFGVGSPKAPRVDDSGVFGAPDDLLDR
jgi:adenosine deaminase